MTAHPPAPPRDIPQPFAGAVDAVRTLLAEGEGHAAATAVLLGLRAGDRAWSGVVSLDPGHRPAPPPETRALVHSLTKTVSAAAALRLVADGLLDLDAPLARWLPEYRFAATATLAQLLQHRAGLPDYGQLPAYRAAVAAGGEPWSGDEFLSRCLPDPAAELPGDGEVRYSNIGYLLVKRLLERAGGVHFADLLRHVVFEPLGLASATVPVRREDLAGLLFGRSALFDGEPVAARYHPGWVAHGVVAMTAADAARFLHGLATTDFLPGELLGRMTAGQRVYGAMIGRPWVEPAYGLGVMIEADEDSIPYWGHTGGGPGCSTAAYHFAGAIPVTVAAITDGEDGAQAEWMAVEAGQALLA